MGQRDLSCIDNQDISNIYRFQKNSLINSSEDFIVIGDDFAQPVVENYVFGDVLGMVLNNSQQLKKNDLLAFVKSLKTDVALLNNFADGGWFLEIDCVNMVSEICQLIPH